MSEDPVLFSVRVEQGDGEDPVVKFKNTMDEFRKMIPYHIEIQTLLAQVQRAKFLALLKEGFGIDHALFLCK
jgi:hypothetical protein